MFGFKKELEENYEYVVAKEKPFSYTTECIQKVIANMEMTNVDQKNKIIQFTSSLSGEGKTTIISNIAYLMSRKNKKVIVVDLDLRKPKMQRVFDVPNRHGLTDYLKGNITQDEMIRHSLSHGVDYILTGEQTNAIINVLESQKLKDLISTLRLAYDYILIDSPPVIAVSDPLYISRLVDGILFCVADKRASKPLVKEAVQTVQRANSNILGMLMTRSIVMEKGYRYRYEYVYNYGKIST
ncbi:CpsD/CapB family tyrosine-protein kinase [Peloplasma aerotolerans]|uniref:non-specific protein-tyrosine kinase n=1 Tax=Peloplasma aerotolerans TaxID=3044389 RepID=A0AAW6U9G0_9MOLU|nr:CpsD/CapB family tyrosine-protein kinase [Mariniplasma sp. M4Ah]MDI6453087.1 CpsD/CapB family tyrosine-protein kinase [Mariniplasma sp. M4Ah]